MHFDWTLTEHGRQLVEYVSKDEYDTMHAMCDAMAGLLRTDWRMRGPRHEQQEKVLLELYSAFPPRSPWDTVEHIFDDDGNAVSTRLYNSEIEAKMALSTLIDCEDCTDCTECIGCDNCWGCYRLKYQSDAENEAELTYK